MTKRQTRLFFISGTALFAVIFLAMTVDSHRQFGRLTNADQITPAVSAGKDVWHAHLVHAHPPEIARLGASRTGAAH